MKIAGTGFLLGGFQNETDKKLARPRRDTRKRRTEKESKINIGKYKKLRGKNDEKDNAADFGRMYGGPDDDCNDDSVRRNEECE